MPEYFLWGANPVKAQQQATMSTCRTRHTRKLVCPRKILAVGSQGRCRRHAASKQFKYKSKQPYRSNSFLSALKTFSTGGLSIFSLTKRF